MSDIANAPGTFDRFAQVGDLAVRVRGLIKRIWIPLIVLLGGEVAILAASGDHAAVCFALLALGTLLILGVWRHGGIGLPMVPVIAIQHLIVYGLPIVTGNELVTGSPPSQLYDAGLELLVFSAALMVAWRVSMQIFLPARPESYALPDFQLEGSHRLKRLGLTLVALSTAYQILDQADLISFLYAMLPSGTTSLVGPLVSGAAACGFFLVALFVGSGDLAWSQRLLFWGLLVLNFAIGASGFLLSSGTTMVAAVLIGLFWSTGKIPWRYVVVVVSVLAFLSVGKITMRGRYWQLDEDEPQKVSSFAQMPALYLEWCEASIEALGISDSSPAPGSPQAKEAQNHQTLFDRINNLQNLIFVIDAVRDQNISPLGGQTYALIPPLLVPRIMWPGEKPRAHEGQVILNVHFGRQDLGSTYTTYVAWGLLPEAYGNFGPFAGSIGFGVFLGVLFAWMENFTARKLLLSLEGFVSFIILLGFANSFEMVASVLVTMIWQSVIPIALVSLPFLRRMTVARPVPPAP